MPRSNLVTYAFVWEKVKGLSTGQVEAKLHIGLLWDGNEGRGGGGGTEVYLNDPGQLTKMAAMPIYGKNPSKIIFFSGTSGPISEETWCLALRNQAHHSLFK